MYKIERKKSNSRILESSDSNKKRQTVTTQQKPDHLFNNIPAAFSKDIPEKHIDNLKQIKSELKTIRDKYIAEDVYLPGETDVNNSAYSEALKMFKSLTTNRIIHRFLAYKIVKDLFVNSIDSKVENHLIKKDKVDKNSIITDKNKWIEYIPKVVKTIGM